MTAQQLADVYGLSLRTIQRDCQSRIYPYVRRAAKQPNNPLSTTQYSWNIPGYIQFIPRSSWIKLSTQKPSTFTRAEQLAFLLTRGHNTTIANCARYLHLTTTKIRELYDELYQNGWLMAAFTNDPEEAHNAESL